MFDGLDETIRTSVYALTALHLPTHSSHKWNQDFLKALLLELKLPNTQYQAFYPLTHKESSVDEISTDVSIESLSLPFLDIVDNAGLVRADLFIALSVYMRFRYLHLTSERLSIKWRIDSDNQLIL
jgi:hypothetical protein